MKFTCPFLALLALPLTFAAPAPNPEPANDITKRGLPGNVYICSGANWTNDCRIVHVGTTGVNTCVKLPYNTVGSIGPDPNTYCIVYEGSSKPPCDSNAPSVGLFNPGNADLYTFGDGFGYRAKYIACWGY
ncbi:hypothetical protein BJ508DRAFT_418139 [Ascobolus immersus RN42]|uniref:Secreted protein n=1 Tax=Ascobolus immersus RN42 TaxID=1160509 RepID=A0A3N4HNR6_ASCIM|nr:hypothetical protein BJ508DRAFT_418139 [Ascobolus immersus RN42]